MAAVVMPEVQTLTAGSAPGTVRVASRGTGGGLADLVADAEMEKVPSPGPPPPVSSRMLRVEVRGLLHDWFDVGEMGDFIRSPEFAGTLRDNVARYFGVPLERQAIYDEDGLLTSSADFSRALQKLYPKLFIYDLEEMGPELKARAVDELRQLDADVEQSWKQFGAGQPRFRQTWQEVAGNPCKADAIYAANAPNGNGVAKLLNAQSPEVREVSYMSGSTHAQPKIISRVGQTDLQASTPARSPEHVVPVQSASPRIFAAMPQGGGVPARTLEQAELCSLSPRILTASLSQPSLPQRAQEVTGCSRLVPLAALQSSPSRPVELHACTPRTQALSAAPACVLAPAPGPLTPRSISPRMQECRSVSPCIFPERPLFVASGVSQGCPSPIHAAWLDQPGTPRSTAPALPLQAAQAPAQVLGQASAPSQQAPLHPWQRGGLPPPPGISFTLKPELPQLQLQPMPMQPMGLASVSPSVSTLSTHGATGVTGARPMAPLSPRVPGL